MRRILLLVSLLLVATSASAQAQVTIKGTVRDAVSREALPGANVQIKGTTNGAPTDLDGAFTLRAEATDTLLVTYVGYVTQSVPVNGRTTINVDLQPDTFVGEEVVVVGYGTQKREALTGSVGVISSDDLAKSPAVTTSGTLVGKTPGVLARQPESRPGASTMIQIRNLGAPLYVIDGVPKDEGQFNNINPNDIESISVLKDASAAAVYGIRGSNGVVLVQTKRGKLNQKNTVEVKTYRGFQSWNRFPMPADAATFVRAQIEADMNANGSTNYTRDQLQKWQDGTEKGYQGFDWYDFAVRENAPKNYFQVSTTGGSDRSNYYVSLGKQYDEAVFRGYYFDRTNLQANLDTKIGKNLTVGAQVNGRIEERRNPGNPGTDDYWQPLFGIYRNYPTERPYANDNPDYVNNTSNPASNFALLDYDKTGYWQSLWRVGQINLSADYQFPIKGLKGRAAYGYYLANNLENTFEYTYDLYSYDEATDTYRITGGNQNPYRDRRTRNVEENILQLQLNYDRTFGKHTVGVDAAFEATERNDQTYWFRAQPATNYIDLVSLNELKEFSDGNEDQARTGYVGRVNYDYAGKYLLEVAGRMDASWMYPPGHRWGLFPSVSAGWRVSEEGFYKNSFLAGTLTNLKLRASIGQLGDEGGAGVRPFDYLQGYTYRTGNYVFDGTLVTGLEPRGLPITNLSWTKSTMTNLGLDYGFFNNKLSGSVEYFFRKRTGIPARKYDVLIPAEVAIDLPQENLNSNSHTGVEGSINYANVINGFQFNIGANATFARMRDGQSYKPRFANSWNVYRNSIEDRWAYINWGYNYIGQFQTQEEIDNYPVNIDGRNNTTLLPGDLIYEDVNGDGIINGMDERPIGFREGSLPYLTYGLNTFFAYKGVDLTMNFNGSAFSSYQREWEMKIPFQNNANSPAYMFEDRWHHEDIWDNSSPWVAGKYPALRKGLSSHSNMRKSDFWLTNVKYLRLETIELGYTLPARMLNRISIDRMRVYANANNLFAIDNLAQYGIDPEVSSTNGLQYPQTRTISVGVTVGF